MPSLPPGARRQRGRKTLVVRKSGKIRGYATIRRCYEGYKIGPLFAADADTAAALLAGLLPEAGDAPVFIDVPVRKPGSGRAGRKHRP